MPGLDQAIEQGRNGPDCSIARRQEAYATFNRILNEEQPYAFGVTPLKRIAAPGGLKGFVPSPYLLATFYDVHRWWIAK